MRQSVLQQSSNQIVGAAFAGVVGGREVEAAQLPAADHVNAHNKCP
jgi:hypothetical protein